MRHTAWQRFELARSVLDFGRRYPDLEPLGITLTCSLSEIVERGCHQQSVRLLARQEAERARKVVVSSRGELERLLRLVVRASRSAARREADPAVRIGLRFDTASRSSLAEAARTALVAANPQAELLVRHGLPRDALRDLAIQLARHLGSIDRRDRAIQDDLAAGAALRSLAPATQMLVTHVDQRNRHRFRRDRNLLARWRSVLRGEWSGEKAG